MPNPEHGFNPEQIQDTTQNTTKLLERLRKAGFDSAERTDFITMRRLLDQGVSMPEQDLPRFQSYLKKIHESGIEL